jgi:hypothetical protein
MNTSIGIVGLGRLGPALARGIARQVTVLSRAGFAHLSVRTTIERTDALRSTRPQSPTRIAHTTALRPQPKLDGAAPSNKTVANLNDPNRYWHTEDEIVTDAEFRRRDTPAARSLPECEGGSRLPMKHTGRR